jgi:DNA-binding NarL/FixJ family response regulator
MSRALLLRARIQQAGQLNRIRVLLADDHPGFPHLVESMLGPAFEIIGSVSNGQSLIDTAMKLKPDVVVTDISMPILNGIEAAVQLKKSGCASKIVFLSIHSDPDFVRACLSTGALGYVIKPRMAAELVDAIQEALAGRIFVSPGLSPRN